MPVSASESAKTSRLTRSSSARGEPSSSTRPQPPAALAVVGNGGEKRKMRKPLAEATYTRPCASRAMPVAAPMSVAILQKLVLGPS